MRIGKQLLLFLFPIVIGSCTKSFLDVKNTQNLYRESYVKDLASMKEYTNGIYVLLSSKFEAGISTAYPELVSDNLRPLSASAPTALFAHYNWLQLPDGMNGMDELWQAGYSIVRACSFVIDNVDKYKEENPSHADDIKGQALALRTYVFFKLVNTFAQPYTFTSTASHPGIPYITTSDITKPYSRQTVSEVYSNMIADIDKAILLLPTPISDLRYMNINAAKALKARILLFKEDYANAKLAATEITNLVPLLTISGGYPSNIYKFKPPTQTETIFQLSPYDGQYGTMFLNYFLRSKEFIATGDIFQILQDNKNDIRNEWITEVGGEFHVNKFPISSAPEVSPAITIPEIAYYPAIFRSSEMFLTVAEAAAKTGDENTARTYLDAIRKRADPSIDPISATGLALLDSIYKERRKELSFEGLRMYDLQRWKKGVARKDALPGSPATLPFPSEKSISPIPASDVKLAGIPQNNSY